MLIYQLVKLIFKKYEIINRLPLNKKKTAEAPKMEKNLFNKLVESKLNNLNEPSRNQFSSRTLLRA